MKVFLFGFRDLSADCPQTFHTFDTNPSKLPSVVTCIAQHPFVFPLFQMKTKRVNDQLIILLFMKTPSRLHRDSTEKVKWISSVLFLHIVLLIFLSLLLRFFSFLSFSFRCFIIFSSSNILQPTISIITSIFPSLTHNHPVFLATLASIQSRI